MGRGALPGLGLLLVACAGYEQGAQESVVRDSAGVSVVEYPQGIPTGPSWSLAAEPTVVIGEADGPEETLFSRVVAAVSGPDGALVIADGQSREIRWFDENGEHLRTVGGSGDGPGEFRHLSWVGRLNGDTIGAWDRSARRLSFFSSAGDLVASQEVGPIEATFDSPPGTFITMTPQVRGIFGDGSMLAELIIVYPNVAPGVRRDSVPLMLFDRGTEEWDRIGTILPAELFIDSESAVALPLPFGLRTQLAVADEWAVIGWGDEAGLTVIDRGGSARAVIRPNLERIRLGQDEIDADRRARIEVIAEPDRDAYRRALQAVAYPNVRPAHGRIVAGRNEFWVEAPSGSGAPESSSWLVFSDSGQYLGSLEAPGGLQITDVGDDHVVGVLTDELGVPRVVRFELRRGVF